MLSRRLLEQGPERILALEEHKRFQETLQAWAAVAGRAIDANACSQRAPPRPAPPKPPFSTPHPPRAGIQDLSTWSNGRYQTLYGDTKTFGNYDKLDTLAGERIDGLATVAPWASGA